MNKLTDTFTLLKLYVLKKEINEKCKDITYNDYTQLKQQKKIYDCLKCTNQEYKLNDDLLNDVNKYNKNKKCIDKYDLIQFYTKLLNKN
jgi:hypothetical protein